VARQRTGRLVWTASRGYVAQLTVDVPGRSKPARRFFPLVSDDAPPLTDRALAKRLMRRLIAQRAGAPAAPAAPSTVDDFALAWIEARVDRGIPAARNELRLWKRIWSPAIGRLALQAVQTSHFAGVYERLTDGTLTKLDGTAYSRESLTHIRAVAIRVFKAAWKAELVPESKAAKVDLPEVEDVKKPRVILSDAEIGALVACPRVDPEIKVLALFARTVAGLRTGDLNRAVWEGFSPGFETYTFVRRKTRKRRPHPETHAVPEAVRPYLVDWHHEHGSPMAGPVFPVRRGARAGKMKAASKQSYASRLRRALRLAGLTRPELYTETPTTLPVDFHSCRRAYATALARAGVNAQEAQLLTGHSDGKVHARYVDGLAVRALPAAAVPVIPAAASLSKGHDPAREESRRLLQSPFESVPIGNPGAGEGIRTLDVHLGKGSTAPSLAEPNITAPEVSPAAARNNPARIGTIKGESGVQKARHGRRGASGWKAWRAPVFRVPARTRILRQKAA
jgi:integrase